MKRFWIVAAVIVLFAGLLAPATPVFAEDGQTVFGNPVTVESGETVTGDLMAFGGPVTVESGGEVQGNVVAWGGPVTIAGRVSGDVTAWGGPVHLRETAVIEGDVIAAGGPVRKSPGAVVEGDVVEGFHFDDLREFRFSIPPVSPGRPAPEVQLDVDGGSGVLSLFFRLLGIGFKAAGVAAIALLVLVFLPEQTHTVKRMTTDQPIASIGVGVLTMLVAALMLGVLIITICGIPVALILGLALLMALLYGWIALGLMVGERLLALLDTEQPLPLIGGVVGVLLITLLSSVPCLGWLVGFVGGCWGLGAVVLSRGGTRDYPSLPGGRPWGPAPPAPPEAPLAEASAEPEVAPETEIEPEQSSTTPTEPAMEDLDDLTAIRGIGPVYETMLREAGIRTYADLAARSAEEVVEAVSSPDTIPIAKEAAQGWIEEARQLAAE